MNAIQVNFMDKIKYSNDELRRVQDEWKRFLQGELSKPMIFFETVFDKSYRFDNPILEKRRIFFSYPPEVSADEIIEIEDAYLKCLAFPGDSYPCISLDFGPGSLSAYMGARVDVRDSVWFFPTAKRLADIPEYIDTECCLYKRVHDILRAATQKWADTPVQIQTSDMGNNLDILAALRGTENLLLDLFDEPELVKQKLKKITSAWKLSYQAEYEKIAALSGGYTAGALGVLAEGKTFRLQSDFAYMISPEMYEEFVLPDIMELADYLDEPCYHLDGEPQLCHLSFLLQIKKIRAIEFVPGTGNKPPKEWTEVYRQIHNAGKQCLSYIISVKEALELKEAMGGSLRGFGLYIGEYMPFDEAEELYKKLIS